MRTSLDHVIKSTSLGAFHLSPRRPRPRPQNFPFHLLANVAGEKFSGTVFVSSSGTNMATVKFAAILLRRRRYYQTETSSSSDDEYEMALRERGKRKLRTRIIGYDDVIRRYTDYEFKSHFRMSKATFEYLLGIIGEDLIRKIKGCPTIAPRQQLMIGLWKMATIDTYTSICDRFNVGRATALRAVRRVTHALFKKSTRFIQWPSGDQTVRVMQGFEAASGFPGVIGAIGGTHIRINAPKENPADYINRKGYHSIQLQLVCDHRTLITHCYAGYPGSVHDQRVFRLSEVAIFLNDAEKFPANSHILGDAAYGLHQHLLTPFRDNGHLTERQNSYNYRHSAARVAVERCIGLLKGRMRSLLDRLPMSRIDLMSEYIIACCVIHNICTLRSDEIILITIPTSSHETAIHYNSLREERQIAGMKRNSIMNNLAH